MDNPWVPVRKYTNLLRNCTEIGTEFTQELLAQQEVLRLARLFGISKTLSLISITGEIRRLTPRGGKVTLFGKTTEQDRVR